MMMTEIKQLFAEELTLLKKIQKYGKGHSQDELERIEKVKLLLLYRIYSNLYSSLLLTAQVLKTGKISFFSYRWDCCCVVALPIACSPYTYCVLARKELTRNLI